MVTPVFAALEAPTASPARPRLPRSVSLLVQFASSERQRPTRKAPAAAVPSLRTVFEIVMPPPGEAFAGAPRAGKVRSGWTMVREVEAELLDSLDSGTAPRSSAIAQM